MLTTRLSSKGQMIVPKAVRDALRLKPGTELIVEPGEDGFAVRRSPHPIFPPSTVDEVCGMLDYHGPPVSLEDMDRGIEEALRERWARKSR